MNQESFEKIYQEHKGLVFRLALTYVRQTEEAEDITQNVFIKVFQKKSQFAGKSQLKTWIFRIATTTCLDHLKSQKATKRSGKLISMHKENG